MIGFSPFFTDGKSFGVNVRNGERAFSLTKLARSFDVGRPSNDISSTDENADEEEFYRSRIRNDPFV